MTTVYGPDTIFPVRAQQLYELHSGCCACRGCVVAYNGVQDRLFRYSSRSFLSLRHLYNFVDQLIGSGINVEAYVNSQRRQRCRQTRRDPSSSRSLCSASCGNSLRCGWTAATCSRAQFAAVRRVPLSATQR